MINLDHIGHWVPDIDTASRRLEQLGFELTPFSAQAQADGGSGESVPAGSGNRCVMLDHGYLEVLTPLADTPVGRELRAGIERHVGVHIAAFEVDEAAPHAERITAAGFAIAPLVSLSRPVATQASADATARFTVIRPIPGSLPEGRVQLLVHHTPEVIWQRRWMSHPNGARALTELIFAVEDPASAARRYATYLGRPPATIPGGATIALDRGALTLLGPAAAADRLGSLELPSTPCMAGYVVECTDRALVRHHLEGAGVDYRDLRAGIAVDGGPSLGGAMLLTGPGHRPG